MTKIITICLGVLLLCSHSHAGRFPGNNCLYFIENKGQIKDQDANPRNDIQYVLPAPGISIFIGNGQLHYQFTKTNIKEADLPGHLLNDYKDHKQTIDPNAVLATVKSYRMDVALEGANQHAQVTSYGAQAYYENYYLAGCPQEGIRAYTCNKIVYKNIYTGIDWVIYIKNNQLEHEFVVGPGGNASDIKIRYSGHTGLKINNDGSIIATTPMGTITEHAPVCFGKDGSVINSSFSLKGNVLSYNVQSASGILIDPVLEWGTYYGPDSNNTSQYGTVCDKNGHIYSCGLTYAPTTGNVATTGSYQSTYGGGCDAFIVKFDTSGNRIWATYYGGANADWGNGIALDPGGNIAIVGTTSSTSTIATSGCQQATFGGGWDGFAAKFDATGSRIWGTYAGGSGLDYPQAIACDVLSNVYISGTADSYTNIATPGSFMPTHGSGHDDFLIQYNSAGARQWGTYYGGNGDDFGGVVTSDANMVFLTGYTSSTGVGTSGTHQPTIGGTSDVYIARFDFLGNRLWATYIGGPDPESSGGVVYKSGNLFVLGATNSNTAIATPGAFQTAKAGLVDAFLAKVNPDLGTMIWCTYFGGPDNENVDLSRIVADTLGNVYITGITYSTSGIASPGTWQPIFGGGDNDAFFAKFNTAGTRYWSTYYGGSGEETPRACAFDGENAYLTGQTNSPNQIATPGSFIDTGGGNTFYFQGFVAKFLTNDTPLVSLSTGAEIVTNDDISIFPNPTNGSFTVQGSGMENGQVQLTVTDVAGRIVTGDETTVTNSVLLKQMRLPESAATGIYFLKIVSQGRTSVFRLLKE